MITLHSLETAAKPFIQNMMVLSFSCAAVSRASRQALTRDSCKSPNTQWKMPSERKRDREVNRERKKERSQEKKEGKKLTINICHQLELLTSLHIIIHTPSPPPTHTHTHNLRVVGRSCPCVTMFSPSRHCLERQSSSSSSLPPAFNSWYSTVCVR